MYQGSLTSFFKGGSSLLVLVAALNGCFAGNTEAPAAQTVARPAPVVAQERQQTEEEMMQAWEKAATPGEMHALLKHYVGNWKATIFWYKDPGKQPEISKGSAKFNAILGGRFVQQDFTGKLGGESFSGRGTIGYDNAQAVFVSTWIDTLGTGYMISQGSLEEESGAIDFQGQYFCPVRNKFIRSREVLSAISNGRFTFTMYGPNVKGEEMKLMEIVYTR